MKRTSKLDDPSAVTDVMRLSSVPVPASQRLTKNNAALVAQAMGFTELVTKSGYLLKRAKHSQRNWKKRYFVLSGQKITYFIDHKSKSDAKGSVFLTPETKISACTDPAHDFPFELVTPDETLRFDAKNEEERTNWVVAIQQTIDEIESSTRAYMEHLTEGYFGKKWVKKFFILHSNAISYYQGHLATSKAQGTFKIDSGSTVQVDHASKQMTVTQSVTLRKLIIRPEQGMDSADQVIDTWEASINETIQKLNETSELAVRPGEQNEEMTILTGYLKTQSVDGRKKEWVEMFYALTNTSLYVADNANSKDANAVYPLNQTCSVFWTQKKKDLTFEVVTAQLALHLQAEKSTLAAEWIDKLRTVISSRKASAADPLLAGAMNIKLRTYDVVFKEKMALGIVLERSSEWALVKFNTANNNEISEGSALCKINDEDLMLQPYKKTISLLTGWQPPLKMSFIRAPVKHGYLAKLSRGRRGNSKNWKRRFFILKHGTLSYYQIVDQPELKGFVHLIGSAVSLVSYEEQKQFYCFKVVSGVATLVMQAETVEEMIEWSTLLYHAIAIANGGGYLLDMQREKIEQEAAETAKREMLRRAEEEAAERKRKAAEAAALMIEKEEAEKQAKKDQEAAAEAASVWRLKVQNSKKLKEEAEEAENLAKLEAEAKAAEEAERAADEERLAAEKAAAAAEAEYEEAAVLVEDIEADIAEEEFEKEQIDIQRAIDRGAVIIKSQEDEEAPEEEKLASELDAPIIETQAATPAEEDKVTDLLASDPVTNPESDKVADLLGSDPEFSQESFTRKKSRRSSLKVTEVVEFGMNSLMTMPDFSAETFRESCADLEPPKPPSDDEGTPMESVAEEVDGDREITIEKREPSISEIATEAERMSLNVQADSVVNEPSDDEEEDEEDKTAVGASTAAATNDGPPTHDEISAAFNILDTRGTGMLNAMQFCNLLRAAGVSVGNGFVEMQLFAKFDTSGEVSLRVEEFAEGLKRLKDDRSFPAKSFEKLMSYIKDIGSTDNCVL